MRRVLKDTGSIYLHCDPTMSHYIKLLMDIVFGEKNFRNEIVWNRMTGIKGNVKNQFPKTKDTIFFYSKKLEKVKYSNIYFPLSDDYIKKFYRYKDEKERIYRKAGGGRPSNYRYYLENSKGKPLNDLWTDIKNVQGKNKERTGYPTQKPISLLERIIQASSDEGDIILDPFCGCATTCIASEKLNRKWVGIDVSVKAYDLVRERLQKEVADPEKLTEYQNKIHYFINPPKRTDLNGDDNIIKKNVYIISHPNYKKADLYKVGIANDLNSRLNSYQTSDPLREYKIEFYKKTQFYRETENYIHKKFSFSHEWVNGKLEDIIKAIEEFDINKYNQTEGILF